MKKIKPPTLRPEEEEEILQNVIGKAKKGESVQRQDVIDLVVKFLQSDKRKNPFRNGVPGDKWFSLFRRRHNEHFMKLEPEMLKAVEKVGFTEKVLNTVTYPLSSVKRDSTPSEKRKRFSRTKMLDTPGVATSPPSPNAESPEASNEEADSSKGQDSPNETADFQPGSRLEVMDFNEKWYPVKVVEVDYEEGEVLVHFEKWSDRYDEWVRMDSNRIRQPTAAPSPSVRKVFEENERVIAVWAYNHKYPATVRKVLPKDKYEVLFCDGYSKVLRGCKLFKATEEDLASMQVPPPKKPAPPMGADPLDPNLGPKEERRMKKRRLDVLEAYRPHKRQRLDPPEQPAESPPRPIISTHKPKEMPKVVLKVRGRPPLKHKVHVQKSLDDEDDDDAWMDDDDDDDNAEQEPEPELSDIEQKIPKRGRKKRKARFRDSAYVYESTKHRSEEDSERWNTDIPAGVSPVQIKDQEGYYRESIIIPDKKMPEGWTKHTMRRRSGSKWDVFLVNPEGRKFRSRNELRNYFGELKQPFPNNCFDFMVGRKMEMIRSQVETRKKIPPGSPLLKATKRSYMSKVSDADSRKSVSRESKSVSRDSKSISRDSKPGRDSTPDQKRIKTLLPKHRHQDSVEEEQAGLKSPSPSLSSPPFPLTELRTPDGGFTCCGKNFRKENLFQMHMKHYHPEYSNLFGSTPNVADLAYARTVGEPLEDSRGEAMNSIRSKYEIDSKVVQDTPKETDTLRTKNLHEKDQHPLPQTATDDKIIPPLVDKVEEKSSVVVKTETEDSVLDEKKTEEEEKVTQPVVENSEADSAVNYEPPVPEMKKEQAVEKSEETPELQPTTIETPTPVEPLPPPPSPAAPPVIPVIKPVSKLTPGMSKTAVTSEAVIVQTSSSPKTPITITKYVPPGQKPTASTTKLTISMTSVEKEGKTTIKTLLPLRPPPADPKDGQDVQKPKEAKLKEEPEEDSLVKSRPRKRTVSESLPKKPKLLKLSTGSLEEDPGTEGEKIPPPQAANNTSYRFSRNRSQVPRVSLEKLRITPDTNGRVVLPSPEDNTANTACRRRFKSFKEANKINRQPEGAESSGETAPITVAPDNAYDNLRKEEIINCTCGYMEEDGLMIQCDLCLCWQHGLCNNIDKESEVPEKYVCYICQHPNRQRPSARFAHNQDWLKEGKLPSLSFRNKEENVSQRQAMLKKSHDLVASLLQLQTVIRSLRLKSHIATKPDHPKLYLWAKSWKSESNDVKNENEGNNKQEEVFGPQPEAAIDVTECRLRLLEHVEDYQHQVEDRLTSIEAQIAALESEDPDLASDEAPDHYPVTKQTVQMILRDLTTVGKVSFLN